jgi:predicted DNA-binding transcriptional regulator YafY
MRKTERLLYILSLLRTHKRLRASDLAKKCGVTERSIYRDIISISAANIPIYFDGGYKLLHNGFLPPTNLSEHESGFLLGLLKSPMLGKGKPFDKTTRVIIDKIESGNDDGNIKNCIDIGVNLTEKSGNANYALRIEEAIRAKKAIVINYLSLKNEESKRKIAPYALSFRKHAWYLIGHCYLRDEIRTFRLGRVEKLKVTNEKIEIPADFSVEEYFRSSWGVYKGRIKKFKVLFKGAAAIAIKTSSHHANEQIKNLDDGNVEYLVYASGEDEFIRWVLGYGSEAEILEPKSTRAKILKMINSTLENYK